MVAAADSAAATLHGPWSGQASWSILERAGEPSLERFISAWQAWREDAERPRLLHYVLVAANPDALLQTMGDSSILAGQEDLHHSLRAAAYGLTTGQHRLSFERGRVLLTLALGQLPNVLRQLQLRAHRLLWLADGGEIDSEADSVARLKSMLRLCRHGAMVRLDRASRQKISAGEEDRLRRVYRQCGIAETVVQGKDSAFSELIYAPTWRSVKQPVRGTPSAEFKGSRSCIVIGAGLAGAAAAASLARRGWSVRVLDSAAHPAAGASGLPVGLLVPHFSADDNLFSRLTRSGARMTWDFLHQSEGAILQRGLDWNMSGVLEILASTKGRPRGERAAGMSDWDRPASEGQVRLAGLATGTRARWHAQAGWIKPASLISALLRLERIEFCGNSPVASLRSAGDEWDLLGPGGEVLASSAVVVIAASIESDALLNGILGLQPVRGQISWSKQIATQTSQADSNTGDAADLFRPPLLPFPVNGNGSFIPNVPGEGGTAWYLGASYQRVATASMPSVPEHRENLERLTTMLPATAAQLAGEFHKGQVKAWRGVRATTPDRMPLLGRVESGPITGIWLSTGMGSRGLSFALLCGEFLAAQLNGEPWPVDRRTGLAMAPGRLAKFKS